jgi:uncharacterized protein (TIGR03382 family)
MQTCLTLALLAENPFKRVPRLTHDPLPPAEKLERDAYGVPNSWSSERFVVRWGNGENIEQADVEELAAQFEYAWDKEVDEMQHPAPLTTETYRFNVYIGDTGDGTPDGYGAGGYYNLDREGYPMIVIPYDSFRDLNYVETVTPHEFYHAIQDATGSYSYSGEGAWYWEATAVWIEPYVNQGELSYADFLPGVALLSYLPIHFFDYPDRGQLQEYHQYGAFIFPRYLSEQVLDWTAIRDSWVEPQGTTPLSSLWNQLAEAGLEPEEVFGDFTAHNAAWDYEDGNYYARVVDQYAGWYGFGQEVDILPGGGTGDFIEAPEDTRPESLGYNVVAYRNPPAGPILVELGLDLVGDRGSEGAWEVRVVVEGETIEYSRLDVVDGLASWSGELAGTEETLYLVVAEIGQRTKEGETFGWRYKVTHPAVEDTGDSGPLDTGGGKETPVACGCSTQGSGFIGGLVLLGLVGLRRNR